MAAPSGRQPSTSIFIGNVGFNATEEELMTIFKQAGPLKSFRLVTDRETGKVKGYAFAEYFDIPTAQSAQRNLNGSDYHGRSLRVDFADSDKHSSDHHHKGPSKPTVVGRDAVQAAGQTMAAALGGPGGAGQQQISEALSKMTRAQIFEIMSQMKGLIQQNPTQARQILVQNPQLTKALFQAQILMGMVSPPPAANGAAAQPSSQPQGQQPGLPAPIQLPVPGAQGAAPAQQPQFVPAQQPGVPFPQPGYPGPAQPQTSFPQQPGPQVQPAGAQGGRLPPALAPPPSLPVPNPMMQPQAAPADPRQRHPVDPRQQQAPMDPRQQGAPIDPRLQGVQQAPLDPRQQQPQPSGMMPGYQQPAPNAPLDPRQQMQQPQPQQPPPTAGLAPAEQQALLRQVMSLTPQQIEMLPDAQKQQVLELQRQLRMSGLPT